MGYRRALAGRRAGNEPKCQAAAGRRRSDRSTSVKRLLSIGSAMTMAGLLGGAGLAVGTLPAHADPGMPHVKYAVRAENPIYTDIYYLDPQPEKFADYSHNPYSFTPHVDVDLAPGKPWT